MKNLLRILVLLSGACPSLFAQQTYIQAFGQSQIDVNRTNAIVQLPDTTYVLGAEWNGIGVLMKVNYKGTLLDYFFLDSYIPGTSKVLDLALDPGGNIIAVGECEDCVPGDTLKKVFAVHTEPSLLFINHKIYEGTVAVNNSLFTPSINRKGNQLLLATTAGGPGWNFEDIVLHAITANLDTIWRKTYNSCSNCGFDYVVDATPTAGGFAFLALNPFTDSLTLWHVDDFGNVLWKKRHLHPAGASYFKLAFRSGTIYAAGSEQVTSGNKGGAIWRFSESNGSLLGKISLDLAGVNDEAANLEFSSDGTLLIVHRRTVFNPLGGNQPASRVYRVNVANSQVIDFIDFPNPDVVTGLSATSVAPFSANGSQFAAAGFQGSPSRSFFFSKNSFEPQPPGVLFSASPDTACSPATVVLTNQFTTAQAYSWYLDGVLFSSQSNPAPLEISDGGTHVIKLDAQTSSTTKINTFTVNSLPEIWNECAFCDNKPDPYLRIKNAAGTVVYTSTFVESYPPVQLPVSFTMQANQSYKFEIWDDDNVGADDLFGTFTIPGNTAGGMFSLTNQEDPDTPLKITFSVTPNVSTQSFTQNVVVFQPIATLTGGNVLQANPGNPAPGSYSFQWQLNGQNIPGATSSTYSPTVSGSYTVAMVTPTCTAISNPVAFTLAFSASIQGTPPLCFGESSGSILVTPSGGASPYNYSWNTSGLSGSNPTNLSAGSYSVTVTDAQGQSTTLQTTLTDPAELILSADATHPTCSNTADGSILLHLSGGTEPISIAWSPAGTGINPTGLTAGTYSATVTDANGCTEFVEVTLETPSALEVEATPTHLTCANSSDGSILLTVSGGVEPISFDWDSTVASGINPTGLSSGTYSATVTDANGCYQVLEVMLEAPQALEVAGESTQTCPGTADGSILLTVSGGTEPYEYIWNDPSLSGNNPAGLLAGSYMATVTDANGCTVLAEQAILNFPEMTLSTSSTPHIDANGGPGSTLGTATVEASGGTPLFTYEWSTTPVQTTSTATDLLAGDYSVTVTDANGCTLVTTVHVDLILDAFEALGTVVRIFPNPSAGVVFIDGNLQESLLLQVFDAAGRLVFSEEKQGLPCKLDLSGLAEGVYWLRMKSDKGATAAKLTVTK